MYSSCTKANTYVSYGQATRHISRFFAGYFSVLFTYQQITLLGVSKLSMVALRMKSLRAVLSQYLQLLISFTLSTQDSTHLWQANDHLR